MIRLSDSCDRLLETHTQVDRAGISPLLLTLNVSNFVTDSWLFTRFTLH